MMLPFREIDAAMHASRQITSNFLTQAGWRQYEIKQPPTPHITSNLQWDTARKGFSLNSYMYDDDDDAYDVNRTPTTFARRNYRQPESYKSSLQKHQAHNGHTGKAMTGPGFDKSIADSAKALMMTMLMMSIEHQQLLPGEIINN